MITAGHWLLINQISIQREKNTYCFTSDFYMYPLISKFNQIYGKDKDCYYDIDKSKSNNSGIMSTKITISYQCCSSTRNNTGNNNNKIMHL